MNAEIRTIASTEARPCPIKYRSRAMDVAAMNAVRVRRVLDFTSRWTVVLVLRFDV